MDSKLKLIITIGILSAASGGILVGRRKGEGLNSNVVMQKVCMGINLGVEVPWVSEMGKRLVEKITNFVDALRSREEPDERVPFKQNEYLNPKTLQDKDDQFKKTCLGYEVTIPVPVDTQNRFATTSRESPPPVDIQIRVATASRDGPPPVVGEGDKRVYDRENTASDTKNSQEAQKVVIEWINNDESTVKPAPRAPMFPSGNFITLNGYPVNVSDVTKYIESLVHNTRRQQKILSTEYENGVFKSEIINYPPDYLKKRLLYLMERKEAREKMSPEIKKEAGRKTIIYVL